MTTCGVRVGVHAGQRVVQDVVATRLAGELELPAGLLHQVEVAAAPALRLGDLDTEGAQRRHQVVDHDLRPARAAPREGDVEDDLHARTALRDQRRVLRADRAVLEVRGGERVCRATAW